jgi:excisionase family DNA binding protein
LPKEVYSPKHGNIRLYTSEELAEILNISADLVGLHIKSGEVRGEKVGKAWYVPNDVIAEYVKAPEEDAGKGIVSRILSWFR